MDRNWESIRDEVFELDPASQAILAEEIVVHLAEDDHTRLWLNEAQSRLRAYRNGEIQAIDVSDSLAAVQRMIDDVKQQK
jgi:hypothetical protein